MLHVKQSIIKESKLSCKYIDISFVLDKPLRVLGKFNVEPGKLPRTLDRYTVDRFAFKESAVIEITEVPDYDPTVKKPIMSGGLGRGRGGGRGRGLGGGQTAYKPPTSSSFDPTLNQQELTLEPVFDLDSQNDFPAL
jgi:hypothetical protein